MNICKIGANNKVVERWLVWQILIAQQIVFIKKMGNVLMRVHLLKLLLFLPIVLTFLLNL